MNFVHNIFIKKYDIIAFGVDSWNRIEARRGCPLASAYVFAFLIVSFLDELLSISSRLEQAAWGIKVSAIKPAFYKTNIISSEMVEEKMTRKWNEGSPEVKLEYGEGCLNKGNHY